ncbi:pyrimidine utilization protein D [Rhodopila sp.]|uniref:pyrimidine utilization protein D n=1 Tax=Rhodopila sp. TaxID=2480087 RepID=UPI003D11DE36
MWHEVYGRSNPGVPTVLLSSGLGGSALYWAANIPALAKYFRVIAYDQTGTGRSPATLPPDYAVADMAAEAAGLLDQLAIDKAHVIGHALGGLIGLQMAADRPALVDRLVLVNAWAKTHPHTLRCFNVRKNLLVNSGVAAYVQAQPLFLYPAAWLAERQAWLADQDAAAITHFPPTETVLRRIQAVEAFDLTQAIAGITAPAMVVAARDDVLVPCTCSITLADQLSDVRLELLDQGGHACNITDPDRFDAMVGDFLRPTLPT